MVLLLLMMMMNRGRHRGHAGRQRRGGLMMRGHLLSLHGQTGGCRRIVMRLLLLLLLLLLFGVDSGRCWLLVGGGLKGQMRLVEVAGQVMMVAQVVSEGLRMAQVMVQMMMRRMVAM